MIPFAAGVAVGAVAAWAVAAYYAARIGRELRAVTRNTARTSRCFANLLCLLPSGHDGKCRGWTGDID